MLVKVGSIVKVEGKSMEVAGISYIQGERYYFLIADGSSVVYYPASVIESTGFTEDIGP